VRYGLCVMPILAHIVVPTSEHQPSRNATPARRLQASCHPKDAEGLINQWPPVLPSSTCWNASTWLNNQGACFVSDPAGFVWETKDRSLF
jgi:hypothetical protein